MNALMPRRQFCSVAAACFSGVVAAGPTVPVERQFTMDLRCGSIGVRADQRRAITLAAEHGFESVTPDARFLATLSPAQRKELVAELQEQNLRWGAAGLSVDFRGTEAAFRDGLTRLPQEAAALSDVGATRIGTWIRPNHRDLTYVQNFRQHADRLRQCCQILEDHGLRFGMEYVGPKTLWSAERYPFIHTMAGAQDLIAEINLPNVGLILDSWHWYTAHETIADLKSLQNSDIVACDLNDAPAGIAVDEQIDNRRELPAATGVIDLGGFLQTLAAIGYDGPVRAEPFNAVLNQMEDDAAVKATADAMRKAFALVK